MRSSWVHDMLRSLETAKICGGLRPPAQAVCLLAGCCSFLLGLVSIHNQLASLLKGLLSALRALCSPVHDHPIHLEAHCCLSD